MISTEFGVYGGVCIYTTKKNVSYYIKVGHDPYLKSKRSLVTGAS